MWFSAKVSVYTADLIFCLRVSFIQNIFIKHQRPALICSVMRISGEWRGLLERPQDSFLVYALLWGPRVCSLYPFPSRQQDCVVLIKCIIFLRSII